VRQWVKRVTRRVVLPGDGAFLDLEIRHTGVCSPLKTYTNARKSNNFCLCTANLHPWQFLTQCLDILLQQFPQHQAPPPIPFWFPNPPGTCLNGQGGRGLVRPAGMYPRSRKEQTCWTVTQTWTSGAFGVDTGAVGTCLASCASRAGLCIDAGAGLWNTKNTRDVLCCPLRTYS